jgi:single-stranded-DNA-specific exonuclease
MSKQFLLKTTVKNDGLLNELCLKYRLNKTVAQILINRGVTDLEKAEKFINPSLSDLHDPFLLGGMDRLCARLRQAIKNCETVVVYGDYDADGITAASILTLFLVENGLEVLPYIPERKNGYGLQTCNLERIAEDFCPDLIITVDCGISAVEEARFVTDELGIDLIITDHHEAPEILPDCIAVNPKIKGCGYPFYGLSGAGVALKVVQAMGGVEDAKKYFDLAAIGTLADCMPMTDENRVICRYGIEQLNKNRRVGIKALADALSLKEITASDVTMKLSPKINAPGRMGSAGAINLFLSKNATELKNYVPEMLRHNEARRQLTDEILLEVYETLNKQDCVKNRALIFKGGWRDGIAGIACSKLKEKFFRPSILFIKHGDLLKGSGRSIEGVDMYKMLSALKDLTVEFGGHAAACGVTIREADFDLFCKRVNAYLDGLSPEIFKEVCYYDAVLECEMLGGNFLEQLNIFEPAAAEDKVTFLYEGVFEAKPFKAMSPHISVCDKNIEVKGFFDYVDYLDIINDAAVKKRLLINLHKDSYTGKLGGILKNIGFATDEKTGVGAATGAAAAAATDAMIDVLLNIASGAPHSFDGIDTRGLKGGRDVFLKYWTLIKNSKVGAVGAVGASDAEQFYYKNYVEGTSYRQFLACLIVFCELKIVDINFCPFSVKFNGVKVDLQSSAFYGIITLNGQ